MEKDTKIKELKEYIASNEAIIAGIDELLTALKTHTGKLVNIAFFKKHFMEKGEYSDWYKYSLSKKQYDFDRYDSRIYIAKEYVEFQNKETAQMIERLQVVKDAKVAYNADMQQHIEKLEAFDEKKLVKELHALYKKYCNDDDGIWTKVLNSYDVKYPNHG